MRDAFGTNRSDAAHLPRTKRLGGDIENAVPLCHHHHCEQHTIGVRSFAAKYSLNLALDAISYSAEFFREHPEVAAKYGWAAFLKESGGSQPEGLSGGGTTHQKDEK